MLDDGELYIFELNRRLCGGGELFEQAPGRLDRFGLAIDFEDGAASADRDVKAGLDATQVLLKWPTEIGQALVVILE